MPPRRARRTTARRAAPADPARGGMSASPVLDPQRHQARLRPPHLSRSRSSTAASEGRHPRWRPARAPEAGCEGDLRPGAQGARGFRSRSPFGTGLPETDDDHQRPHSPSQLEGRAEPDTTQPEAPTPQGTPQPHDPTTQDHTPSTEVIARGPDRGRKGRWSASTGCRIDAARTGSRAGSASLARVGERHAQADRTLNRVQASPSEAARATDGPVLDRLQPTPRRESPEARTEGLRAASGGGPLADLNRRRRPLGPC